MLYLCIYGRPRLDRNENDKGLKRGINMSREYHHGDLRNALIQEGLRIINEEGLEKLSIRKVAAACGVSHAAPKAHFQNKEALLNEIRKYVTEQFTKELREALQREKKNGAEAAVISMGRQYVRFFMNHPEYYQFFFCQKQAAAIHLNIAVDDPEDFSPFRLFRAQLLCYNGSLETPLSEKELEKLMIKAWTVVHGIASIACMDNVVYDGSWEDMIEELIE